MVFCIQQAARRLEKQRVLHAKCVRLTNANKANLASNAIFRSAMDTINAMTKRYVYGNGFNDAKSSSQLSCS